jgi:predicted transporter
VPVAKDERVGRLVGAILITEGVLVAILRFLALVYVVSSEAFNADRLRTPLPDFLPWVLITVAVSFVLVWAGSFLRRAPTGAWRDVRVDARIDLVAACLLNVGALAWAASGIARSPSTVEAWLTWIALAVASLVTIAGIVRDAFIHHRG